MNEIRQGNLMAQYSRQVRKKAKTKPFSQATLMMRANGTAIAVLEFIDEMSFRDLSLRRILDPKSLLVNMKHR